MKQQIHILRADTDDEIDAAFQTVTEFVINLKTARTLGLDVPLGLSAGADELIE